MARKKVVDADSAVAAPHDEDVKKIAERAEDPTPEDTSELRDKIAIAVLNGYISYMGCDPEAVGPMGNRTTEKNKDILAKASYAYAEAMIKARG